MRIIIYFLCIIPFLVLANPNDTNKENEIMLSTAQQVLNDLKRSKGILPHEAPIVKSVFRFGTDSKIATVEGGEICLDSKTYLLCRGMGKDSLNALAFILGHELGHFINKHDKVGHNILPGIEHRSFDRVTNNDSDIRGTDFKLRLQKALDEFGETHGEAEADFEGAFLGYLSGYQTLDAGKELLTIAYKEFSLDTLTAGYPSLDQRIEIINNTKSELEQLTPLFELSKYLTATGQYADAIPLLECVLEKFQSPEIYNNIGVIQLLHIQSLFEKPICKYQLPITLDADFRAPHPQFFNRMIKGEQANPEGWTFGPTIPCEKNLIQRQIDIAVSYFYKSILQDPDYSLAHLNLSIAYTLQAILFDPIYHPNDNPDVQDPVCGQMKSQALNKAKSSIANAIETSQKDLKGYCIEYYTVSPSKTHTLISYPKQVAGMVSREKPKHEYPLFMECFDTISLSIYDSGKPIKFTRWNTPDFHVPNQGVVYSNILMQADIINLLDINRSNDNLDFAYPYPIKMLAKSPFERALEINPKNITAQINQSKYHETPMPKIETSENPGCTTVENFQEKNISEIVDNISDWFYTRSISQSRVMPYFQSGDSIRLTDLKKIKRKLFNIKQNVQFAITEDFKLYVNQSESENHLTERVIFLIPHSLPVTTNCNVAINTPRQQLLDKYGHPNRKLQISNGELLTYSLSSDTKETHEKTEETFPPPEVIAIDRIEQFQDGLIFQLDGGNKVDNWIIYHKYLQSEAKILN